MTNVFDGPSPIASLNTGFTHGTDHASLAAPAMTASALAMRLERFVDLEDCEKDFTTSLESSAIRCQKGRRLTNVGDPTNKVWLLKSGWAVLKDYTREHGNQILRIYMPGEFIGLSEFGTKQAPHQIVMQTDGVVAEIGRKTFHRRLAEFPRLGSLLFAIGTLNLTAFHHQVARSKTMCAQRNLKFFLLHIQSRLHDGHEGLGDRFELPMSQVEIGQVLGITSIYVNKLLRKFVTENQLEIDRPYFRLKTRSLWQVETEFTDAYANIDTSWFSTEIARPRDHFVPRRGTELSRFSSM